MVQRIILFVLINLRKILIAPRNHCNHSRTLNNWYKNKMYILNTEPNEYDKIHLLKKKYYWHLHNKPDFLNNVDIQKEWHEKTKRFIAGKIELYIEHSF